jgi:hypothetical protein
MTRVGFIIRQDVAPPHTRDSVNIRTVLQIRYENINTSQCIIVRFYSMIRNDYQKFSLWKDLRPSTRSLVCQIFISRTVYQRD